MIVLSCYLMFLCVIWLKSWQSWAMSRVLRSAVTNMWLLRVMIWYSLKKGTVIVYIFINKYFSRNQIITWHVIIRNLMHSTTWESNSKDNIGFLIRCPLPTSKCCAYSKAKHYTPNSQLKLTSDFSFYPLLTYVN